METQNTDTQIQLIGKDITYIKGDISDIKTSIKELAGIYITKLQFDDYTRSTENRLKIIEKTSSLWKWLGPTLSAIMASIVTFLVINYIQHSAK